MVVFMMLSRKLSKKKNHTLQRLKTPTNKPYPSNSSNRCKKTAHSTSVPLKWTSSNNVLVRSSSNKPNPMITSMSTVKNSLMRWHTMVTPYHSSFATNR